MKKGFTVLLQVVICLIAVVVLAALIRFPQTEGGAANLDLISIYTDPLIIYGYIASIPFFVGLYQAFKLLGYIDANKTVSKASVKALQTIKYCAFALPVFIILGDVFIVLNANGDDYAGPVALGVLASFTSICIAIGAGVFQSLLQKRMHKSRR